MSGGIYFFFYPKKQNGIIVLKNIRVLANIRQVASIVYTSVGWHRRVKCGEKAFPGLSTAEAYKWKASNQVKQSLVSECGDRWYEETRESRFASEIYQADGARQCKSEKKQYLEFLMLGKKQCIRIISKNCEKVNPRQMLLLEDLSFKNECSF